MILADAHFSHDTPRNSVVDLPVACFPRAREPGSTPSNRRAPQVCRKAPQIDLGRPPAVDLSVAPLARLALGVGFDLSERSVSRWIRRAPRNPDPLKRWLTFLRNHREAIAAMDFFTVPTLTVGVLYCFFVIGHDRRKILHFNVTRNPHALWVVQQLREACAYKES